MYATLFLVNLGCFIAMIRINIGIAMINLVTCILLAYILSQES